MNRSRTSPSILWQESINLVCLASFWLILFWQLHFEWTYNSQYNYGTFVPFLGAYLLYLRWREHPSPKSLFKSSSWGVSAIVISVALVHYPLSILFAANVDWRFELWTQAMLLCVVTALMLLQWGGWPWLKHFWFPFAFVLIAVPWPRFIEIAFVEGLMKFVASTNVQVLSFLGEYATRMGNILYLKTGPISIAEACSGVRSFQSTLMGGLFLGELLRLPLHKRIALVILAAMASFFFNITRTCALAFIAIDKGPQELEQWHDTAGYSVLIASFIVLAILAYIMKNVGMREALLDREITKPIDLNGHKKHALKPQWCSWPVCLLTICILGSTLWVTDAWYTWRLSFVQRQPTWTVKWPTHYPDFHYKEISSSIQDTLFFEVGLNPEWTNSDGHHWVVFFFKWDCAQAAQLAGYHTPEWCMPAVGWTQISKGTPLIWQKDGVTLIFNTYIFKHLKETVYVFNCQWDPDGYPFYTKVGREYEDRIRDIWMGNIQEGKQTLEAVLSEYANMDDAKQAFREWLDRSIIVEASAKSADVMIRMPQSQQPSTDSVSATMD